MGMLARIKGLDESRGVQYLLDAAFEVLKNPIAMFDTAYALQAYTDVITDDPLWMELVGTGTFSAQTQAFFANEYFTEDVANADKVVVLRSGQLAYDRILGNIYNRDQIKVSNIVMVACNAPIGDDMPAAVAELAEKISRAIYGDEYFTAYGRASHQSIIRDLLDGVIHDSKVYTPHVQILYEGFEDYLYLAVVEAPQEGGGQENSRQDGLERLRSLLLRSYPQFKYAIYAGYIVMIMSAKHAYFDETWFFDAQGNPIDQYNLYVGVSESFENLYELRKQYDQAVHTLSEGRKGDDGRRIYTAGERPE